MALIIVIAWESNFLKDGFELDIPSAMYGNILALFIVCLLPLSTTKAYSGNSVGVKAA